MKWWRELLDWPLHSGMSQDQRRGYTIGMMAMMAICGAAIIIILFLELMGWL